MSATPLGSGAGPAQTTTYREGDRITPDELRTMFLFDALDPEQLDWITRRSRVELFPAGGVVYTEGEPATCFYVLLAGTIAMTRRVASDEVEITRSDQRGAYAGATASFTDPPPGQQHRYPGSLHAVTDVAMMALPADEFAPQLRAWFPMAMHLIEGMLIGQRNSQIVVGQREKLLALGSLTAGLTHELNNPAAAAVRATSSLRERIAGMRHKLALLAKTNIDAEALAPARRDPGGRGQAGRGRPDAVAAGDQRPRGRHGQLARGPRGRRRVGTRADLRRGRAHPGLDGAAAVGDRRGGPRTGPSAGWRTASRPRCS